MAVGLEDWSLACPDSQAWSAGWLGRGVAATHVSVALSWPYRLAGPLGCQTGGLRGAGGRRFARGGAQFSLHLSAIPALTVPPTPSWGAVSHVGVVVGQDLRSLGKGSLDLRATLNKQPGSGSLYSCQG